MSSRYLEFDGTNFGLGSCYAEVENFKGARPITSLTCYPLEYHKDAEKIREALIERGKKFVMLSTEAMQFKMFKGLAYRKKNRQAVKLNVESRICIDPKNFRRINANYPVSTIRNSSEELFNDGSDGECGCGGEEDDDSDDDSAVEQEQDPKTKLRLVVTKKKGKEQLHYIRVEVDKDGNEVQPEQKETLKKKPRRFTELDFLIASPVVLAFSLSEKMWLECCVSGVDEIEFNDDAWPSLVIPPKEKDIILSLVTTHMNTQSNFDDVIQGKGKGMIAVPASFLLTDSCFRSRLRLARNAGHGQDPHGRRDCRAIETALVFGVDGRARIECEGVGSGSCSDPRNRPPLGRGVVNRRGGHILGATRNCKLL